MQMNNYACQAGRPGAGPGIFCFLSVEACTLYINRHYRHRTASALKQEAGNGIIMQLRVTIETKLASDASTANGDWSE